MVYCTSVELRSLQLKQLLPELAHEDLIPIRDNRYREPMQPYYPLDEFLSYRLGGERMLKRDEMPILDSLSTTTRMVSNPRDLGNFSIKSIDISSHIC